MSGTSMILVFVIIVAIIGSAYIAYLYFRDRSLDEIRVDVYKLFLKAEHKFTGTKEGKQKLKWVVQQARTMLPVWLSVFITEELLTMIIDEWFIAVKDLLDDGKVNGSSDDEDDMK